METSNEIKKLIGELKMLEREYTLSNNSHVHFITSKNKFFDDFYNSMLKQYESEAEEYRKKISIIKSKLILLGHSV